MPREVPDAQRKRPRQARSRATVDAILMSAAHILKSEGLERATTNRIAERAGVSVGSLYQYFPNKHAIVAELRRRQSEWFNGCVQAEIERATRLPLRPALRTMVELVIALHAIDPEHHNAMAEGRAISRDEERRFRRLMQEGLAPLGDAVRPVDLELASFIVIRTLEALVHSTALDEPERLSNPRFAEEVSELLIRYLESPEAR